MNRLTTLTIGMLGSVSLMLFTWFDWQNATDQRIQIQKQAEAKLKLATDLASVQKKIQNLGVFYSEDDVDQLFERIEKLKNKLGLRLTASEPSNSTRTRNGAEKERRIKVEIKQCSMKNVLEFVHSLETQGKSIRLENLSFSKTQPRTSPRQLENWTINLWFRFYVK